MTAVVNLPDGRSVKAVSPALRFRVDYPSSALRDTVEMAANRPNFEAYPMTLGERFQRQWPFWAAVLASAALVAAVWWLRRRRLRGTVDPRLSVVRAARSPFETAPGGPRRPARLGGLDQGTGHRPLYVALADPARIPRGAL